ncbi:MAG: hypothetical protein ACK56F_22560, partial [bacterium]
AKYPLVDASKMVLLELQTKGSRAIQNLVVDSNLVAVAMMVDQPNLEVLATLVVAKELYQKVELLVQKDEHKVDMMVVRYPKDLGEDKDEGIIVQE